MQTARKKPRGPSFKTPKRKTVGGLIKFTFYLERVSSSRPVHKGIIGHILDQLLVIVSEKVDDDGRVPVLQVYSSPTTMLRDHPFVALPPPEFSNRKRPSKSHQIASISKNEFKRLSEIDFSIARFVPIEPSEPHPDTGTILCTGPGARKRLPSDPHVDIGESTLVPYGALRDYNGARNGREKLSLTPESYVQLAEMWASWEAAESAPGSRLDSVYQVALLTVFSVVYRSVRTPLSRISN